jgi:DNA repair exonuclease SbcCD ATPase subunit
MTKIKAISISGIRGIRELLPLDLNTKSVLVYGDNGSGKSSLSDALEWFYFDQIDHLSGEEIGRRKGKDALRNIFIPDEEDSFVEILYSDNALDATKKIKKSLETEISNTSSEFQDFINSSQSENLILRYRDLVKFIIASKKDKLNTLQEIIGFREVGSVRDLLKKSAGRISRSIKTANYDNQKSARQTTILENLGQNVYSREQLFEAVSELIKPLKLGIEIKSFKDIKKVLTTIESKKDTTLVEKISFYSKVGESLSEIIGNVDNIHDGYKAYYDEFIELRKDPDKIKKLQLLSLLTEGKSVLENDVVQEDFCPLCQQEKNKLELVKELNERIEELEELRSEKKKLDRQRQDTKQAVQNSLNTIDGLLMEKLFKEEELSGYLEKTEQIRLVLNLFLEELTKDLFAEKPIQELAKLQIDKKKVTDLIEQAKKNAKELSESQKENFEFQVYAKLVQTIESYKSYESINNEQQLLTKQQVTFEALFADFIKRQEEALNIFLDMFSNDINEFYTSMNPSERVENIKLVPLKDKNDDLVGVTIEYSFFDETKTPPVAYLSESHINCLGLSFFLASVKAFNKTNKLFVLDDVISSFDRPHRARFAKLLTEKFSDYQIILMTHEKDFFELVASDVKSKGWAIENLKWSQEGGTGISKGLTDIEERIINKFADKNSDGLGNDIRVYMEKVMKKVALNIEAPVPFRFNDKNERRMAPELLDAVQSRISKKGTDLKDKANIPKIKGMPMFVANVSSHDNEFQASIEDLEVMWEDIKGCISLFYCSDCKKYVSKNFYDNVEKKIRCGCGMLSYEWQD